VPQPSPLRLSFCSGLGLTQCSRFTYPIDLLISSSNGAWQVERDRAVASCVRSSLHSRHFHPCCQCASVSGSLSSATLFLRSRIRSPVQHSTGLTIHHRDIYHPMRRSKQKEQASERASERGHKGGGIGGLGEKGLRQLPHKALPGLYLLSIAYR
jgi:hypothetical protein